MAISSRPIFMDKDGVIIEADGTMEMVKKNKLLPGAIEALKMISDSKLFIVTNQSWISRGEFSEKQIIKKHEQLEKNMSKKGVKIAGIYHCPHGRKEGCPCRKPKDGLVRRIKQEHIVDMSRAIFIGDRTSDIKLGKEIGATTILVETGFGGKDGDCDVKADHVVADILSAAKLIIEKDL